jgi:formylglycine-generating enzyme required for sulfatase activity/tRNA A-37 threonylcarbamoyl transferase component Bud32
MSLLRDRYRLLDKLGSGGFGHTFVAEDTSQAGALCAVKVLKPVSNPDLHKIIRDRFEREAAVLRALGADSRGHIPKLYDFFSDGGVFYLVQELIDGLTLAEKVTKQGPLDVNSAMNYLDQLLEVLSYIHQSRIIHRDVKPENVVVRHQDEQVVLLDFGLVKEVVNLDSRGNPTTSIQAGTQGYMPPEQQRGKPVYASDLYALGWTGIFLLTGRDLTAFGGPRDWHRLAPGVANRFVEILDKSTELDVALRFSTAADMLRELYYAGARLQRLGTETFRNAAGLEFVLIPPGTFAMGSEKRKTEGPAHLVTIDRSFYMARYQTTQAQWFSVIGTRPSKFKGDDLPVETVSWNDVHQFMEKLNAARDGYEYRLPSEAEWEYACRAGATTDYCFGDDAGELQRYAWYESNSDNRPHPVGEKEPNAWGLYDVHGNVWEWCEDGYWENYGGAPTDGSPRDVQSDLQERVLRGGGWNARARNCRCAWRRRNAERNRGYHDGFRVMALKSP